MRRATIRQVNDIAEAGADIVRVSCPDVESTKALKEITKASPVPIVADIHFHYKRGIEAAEAGAACLRINPGNIGSEERVQAKSSRPQRIMVAPCASASMAARWKKTCWKNMASLVPDAMVESALDHAKILQDNDFHEFKISVKGL